MGLNNGSYQDIFLGLKIDKDWYSSAFFVRLYYWRALNKFDYDISIVSLDK